MIRKLQIQLVTTIVLVAGVLMGTLLVTQYRATAQTMRSDSIAALEDALDAPLGMTRPGEPVQPYFFLARSPRGELLASGSGYYDLSDTDTLEDIYRLASESGKSSDVLEGYSLRFLRRELVSGTVYVFTDISPELLILKQLRGSYTLTGLGCLAAFFLLALFLSRRMLRPVEQAWQQQRQFVADASHELKTPLTVILTNAELLREWDDDPQRRQQFTGNILAMSRQMRGLVESLLQLARADSGQTRAEVSRLDLSALAENAMLPFEPVYFEQGLMLESKIQPEITLTGCQTQLRQVVEILLDNGLKYSTPGGTVRLSLERQGKNRCLLRVTTPGTPLTEQQCRDIFRRFYRADPVRSMNHSYGLGLSIAQRIVHDHRGRIWAQGGSEENSFFVQLPLT